jgi:hypothetical protein
LYCGCGVPVDDDEMHEIKFYYYCDDEEIIADNAR